MAVRVVTLNVQGLNVSQKRVKGFRHLASLWAHMACLQEMHLPKTSTPKFFHKSYPQVHTASDNVKKERDPDCVP